MPESSDFERKRAELERRRENVRISHMIANMGLLPAEGRERVEHLIEAFLVADEDETARLIAAAQVTPHDSDAVEAIVRDVLNRHSHSDERKAEVAAAPDSQSDRLADAEFVALTADLEDFTVELVDGVPYVGGQPVEVGAFRQAMLLLRTRPARVDPPEPG